MDSGIAEVMDQQVSQKIFSDVSFCVSGFVEPKILKLLENGGAKARTYVGMGVTHFIAGRDAVELKVEEARDIFDLPIVHPRWVEYCSKAGKILPINGFSGESNQLFSKVRVTPSGIKGSDLKYLWANVTYYGGSFSKRLTKKTTHLISNTCTGQKFEMALREGIPIVCCDWITDSIRDGSLIDTSRYNPSLIVNKPQVQILAPPPPIPIPPTFSIKPEVTVDIKTTPIPIPISQLQPQSQVPQVTPIHPPPTSQPQPQFHPTASQQEQIEIIRYIRTNPDLREQWTQIGEEQRALVVQKLAQKHRDEQLRRQMMIRQQQQMNLQNSQQNNLPGQKSAPVQPVGFPNQEQLSSNQVIPQQQQQQQQHQQQGQQPQVVSVVLSSPQRQQLGPNQQQINQFQPGTPISVHMQVFSNRPQVPGHVTSDSNQLQHQQSPQPRYSSQTTISGANQHQQQIYSPQFQHRGIVPQQMMQHQQQNFYMPQQQQQSPDVQNRPLIQVSQQQQQQIGEPSVHMGQPMQQQHQQRFTPPQNYFQAQSDPIKSPSQVILSQHHMSPHHQPGNLEMQRPPNQVQSREGSHMQVFSNRAQVPGQVTQDSNQLQHQQSPQPRYSSQTVSGGNQQQQIYSPQFQHRGMVPQQMMQHQQQNFYISQQQQQGQQPSDIQTRPLSQVSQQQQISDQSIHMGQPMQQQHQQRFATPQNYFQGQPDPSKSPSQVVLAQHHMSPHHTPGNLEMQQHQRLPTQMQSREGSPRVGQSPQPFFQSQDALKSSNQIITNQNHHGGGIIRTQQILTPQLLQQRLNVRQVMIHQSQNQQPYRMQINMQHQQPGNLMHQQSLQHRPQGALQSQQAVQQMNTLNPQQQNQNIPQQMSTQQQNQIIPQQMSNLVPQQQNQNVQLQMNPINPQQQNQNIQLQMNTLHSQQQNQNIQQMNTFNPQLQNQNIQQQMNTFNPQQQQNQNIQLRMNTVNSQQQNQNIQLQMNSQQQNPNIQMQMNTLSPQQQNQNIQQQMNSINPHSNLQVNIQGQQIGSPHQQHQQFQLSPHHSAESGMNNLQKTTPPRPNIGQPQNQWMPSGSNQIIRIGSPNQLNQQVQIHQKSPLANTDDHLNNHQQQLGLRQQSPSHGGNAVYGGTDQQHNVPLQIHAKTKTVLANMLNTRLQGNTGAETGNTNNGSLPFPSSPTIRQPVASSIPQSPGQMNYNQPPQSPAVIPTQNKSTRQTLVAQRKNQSAANFNANKVGPQTPGGNARVGNQQVANALTTVRPHHFIGHDPSVKLPPEGFLLGCIFWSPFPNIPEPSWKQFVKKYGGEIEDVYNYKVTHVLSNTQQFPEFTQALREGKRIVTFFWLSDICLRKSLSPPFYSIHLPVPFSDKDKPLKQHKISTTGFKLEEKARLIHMLEILGAKYTNYFNGHNTALVALKPEGRKYQKAREWRKPVINIQFLNELIFGHVNNTLPMIHSPKYQQFNTEQPFRFDIASVLHLMVAWKVPIRVNNDTFDKFKNLKRPLEFEIVEKVKQAKMEERDLRDLDLLSPPPTTPSSLPSILPALPSTPTTPSSTEVPPEIPPLPPLPTVIVILTGFPLATTDKTKIKLEKLGARITTNPKEATHLVMPERQYTEKFFTCLCSPTMSYIVTLEWVLACVAKNELVDATPYLIYEPSFDEKYQTNVATILTCPGRDKLLNNFSFYLSPNVQPARPLLRSILQSAGGKVVELNSIKTIISNAKSSANFFIITCDKDVDIFQPLLQSHLHKVLEWNTILCSLLRQTTELIQSKSEP